MSPENKLRLLIIYAIVYPEKFEGDKGEKLMQVLVSFFTRSTIITSIMQALHSFFFMLMLLYIMNLFLSLYQ
jgi:uncharacterized membrane protein